MPDLSKRSTQLELLDAPDIPSADLWQNLRELEVINRWLGGYAVTLAGLAQLIQSPDREWRLADVGCGGGDTLRAIARWATRQGLKVHLTGIDLKAECIAYAQQASPNFPIEWIQADYREVSDSFDIVVTSLFCHHLTDDQLGEFLRWLPGHAQTGFLINDLHRHPLAYHGIQFLTGLLSRSRLVRHDAALSVWRGFRQPELETLLVQAGLQASVRWYWAFRYLVLGRF